MMVGVGRPVLATRAIDENVSCGALADDDGTMLHLYCEVGLI